MNILASVAIDKQVLHNSDNIDRIVEDYASIDVDGYIVFPFNINELVESSSILENLAKLSLWLKATGKLVITYVAEFGNILISLGIDAITCGICSHKSPYDPRLFEAGIAEFGRTWTQLYVHSIFRKLHSNKFLSDYTNYYLRPMTVNVQSI